MGLVRPKPENREYSSYAEEEACATTTEKIRNFAEGSTESSGPLEWCPPLELKAASSTQHTHASIPQCSFVATAPKGRNHKDLGFVRTHEHLSRDRPTRPDPDTVGAGEADSCAEEVIPHLPGVCKSTQRRLVYARRRHVPPSAAMDKRATQESREPDATVSTSQRRAS
jgi:hypothetical protein